jgi:hypothetical protein
MAADPASVLLRLAVLQRLIARPGATPAAYIYAYDNPPLAITTGSMPLFVNYVGPLQTSVEMGRNAKGIDYMETRLYYMVLYLMSYGAGEEGEYYGLLTPYFDAVAMQFGAYPHLNQLNGIEKAKMLNDSGGATVPFANTAYYGIRFVLQVAGRVFRPFAPGE